MAPHGAGHWFLLHLLTVTSSPAFSRSFFISFPCLCHSGKTAATKLTPKPAGTSLALNLLLSDTKHPFPFLLFCFIFLLNWFLSNDCPIHLSTRLLSNLREICHHFNFMLQPLHCLALRINLSNHFNFPFSLLLLSLAYYFLQHASNSQIKTWQWPFKNCKYWWPVFSFPWMLIHVMALIETDVVLPPKISL